MTLESDEGVRSAWARLSMDGWSDCHATLAALYPMPGDDRFEDNDLFARVPIFPLEKGIVLAGDPIWWLPTFWFRELETRPESQRTIKFDIPIVDKVRLTTTPCGAAQMILLQKALYVESFRARRPLAISTLRRRLDIYGAFIKIAVAAGKPVAELDYADLVRALGLMNTQCRRSVPAVYETLRWWRAQQGANYPFFDLPPSPEALLSTDVSESFNPENIRDDEDIDGGLTWQPLPDTFVAAAGKIVIELVELVRPQLLACLKEINEYRNRNGQLPSEKQYFEIMSRYSWPEEYIPRTIAEFRKRCRQAQTATIFLLSLLVGPRASEVLSIPRGKVTQAKVDGQVMHFLDGTTFKLSRNYAGEKRDWPIHELLGQALLQQDEYIELTEGNDFKFLWKNHEELFSAGDCLRGINPQLTDFVEQFALEKYLDGTRCHHHRFRKTAARLIVIALYGGSVVLRRLFGHQHLAMTLRYILANTSIIDELREIAEEEQRALAEEYARRSNDLLGKGGEAFRGALAAAAEALSVTVPDGKREQAEFTVAELVAFLADGPDGLTVKQILPGLLACFKPRDEAGACCSSKDLPNAAKCSAECKWQIMTPEFGDEVAATNVEDALEHLSADPDNPLTWSHYREVVIYWISRFPELLERHKEHRVLKRIMDEK